MKDHLKNFEVGKSTKYLRLHEMQGRQSTEISEGAHEQGLSYFSLIAGVKYPTMKEEEYI